jgi:hypothetical protein
MLASKLHEVWFPFQSGFAVTIPLPGGGAAILYKHKDRWRAKGYEYLTVHEL